MSASSTESPAPATPPWCSSTAGLRDHSYFSPQLDYFETDHRVVGVDLRGHGASDAPEGDYSMPALADDVAWVCGQLGITGAIVVGHSMGAVIGTQLVATHPEVAEALVLVDPATIGPPNELVSAFADSLAGPDGAQVRRSFVEARLFSPTDDAEIKERVLAEMLRVDDRVAAACMRGLECLGRPVRARVGAGPNTGHPCRPADERARDAGRDVPDARQCAHPGGRALQSAPGGGRGEPLDRRVRGKVGHPRATGGRPQTPPTPDQRSYPGPVTIREPGQDREAAWRCEATRLNG